MMILRLSIPFKANILYYRKSKDGLEKCSPSSEGDFMSEIMRIVLFYAGVESFNYFTDCLFKELCRRGHECFILDLLNQEPGSEHSIEALSAFLSDTVHMTISYDGLGIREENLNQIWNALGTVCINILMDHPLRFHRTMENHPKNYVQLCCDENHVLYTKEYFAEEVEYVTFMPHAGTHERPLELNGYENRPIDILFSGTYYAPQHYMEEIEKNYADSPVLVSYLKNLAEYMITHTDMTTEQAASDVLEQMQIAGDLSKKRVMLALTESVDWMVRMIYRERVIHTLASAGFQLHLLGRGWENHPDGMNKNVHIISDRVPFAETFPYMAKAKINLNVMPWFKAGTHDRIFNTLLQGSLPLSDGSSYLHRFFKNEENILYYDINHLENLPSIAEKALANPELARKIITNGYETVKKQFSWEQIVDSILKIVSV